MKNFATSLIVSFALVASVISAPAHAAEVSFPCGTSGSYTVTDGVLTGHSSCSGNLNIDSSVVEIASEAFANNVNLAAINIPGSVITVGSNAFGGASATSLMLGEGIVEIQHGAFSQLNNYGFQSLDISIPDSVTTLGDGAFQQNRIGRLLIGDSLVTIPSQAFYSNFGGGVTLVEFGASVKNVGMASFSGYRGSSLFFPEGLETIESRAFEGAYSLSTVLLPSTLTSIANDSFTYSPSTTVYCGTNPDIANFAFPAPNTAKVCGNLVSFDGNGSNNYESSQQLSNSAANLTTFNWSKTDSVFVRWTTNRDGSGAQYLSGGLFPFTEQFTTLYAQWQVVPKVVFDGNTGSGEMSDQSSLAAATLNPLQFSKCGFDFAGWSTNQNGGPMTYQNQASFPFVDAQTRLYAQWTPGSNSNPVKTDVTWNPVNGTSLSNAFSGNVLTMAVNPVSGELYAGGLFTNVAGIPEADYIAKWDGFNWSALGSNGLGNGAIEEGLGNGNYGVFDLEFDGSGNLYVTGNFTISGVSSYFAKWNGSDWSSVGTGLEFDGSGRAIAVDSRNQIYLGGQFQNVAGDPSVDYLAKWNGTEWTGVGNSEIDGYVRSIDIGLNDNVYVGTWTENIGGIPEADYIAKWNGSFWSALGGTLSGDGQLQDMPRNIAVDSRSGVDIVYVGNLSSRINDVNGNELRLGYFIKWDGTRWGQALPDVVISQDYVTDVALAPGGGLVVGGWFNSTGSVYGDSCKTYQKSLAYFDGTSTFGLGSDGSDPSFDRGIDSVVVSKDGHIFVGGSFRSASDNPSASRIAMSSISFTQNPPPTASTFPTFKLNSRQLVSSKGQTLTLNGTNLDDVTAVKVGGKDAKILKKSSDEIVIDVPAVSEGYPEVELVSSSGIITMQGLLKVVKPYASKRTLKITQFSGNLPTKAGMASLKKSYLKSPTANILSCISTVASNSTSSQVAKAATQAKVTCQSVIKYSRFIKSADVQVSKTGKPGSKPVLAVTFDRTLSGS